MEFRLPVLGEGIESATVVRLLVAPGASISEGQDVLEVETDKASVMVASDVAGTVTELLASPGAKVKVGQPILRLQPAGMGNINATVGAAPPASTAAAAPSAPAAASDNAPAAPAVAPPPTPTKPAPVSTGRMTFRLPNLGEGIDAATVVEILVAPGSSIQDGQEVLQVETDKASVPVVVDLSGVVQAVLVSRGQKIKIGTPVLEVEGISASAATPTPASPAPAPPPPLSAAATPVAKPTSAPPATTPPATAVTAITPALTTGSNGESSRLPSHLPVPAGPATRRLARELGVELHQVKGSARGGRVTIDDLKNFVRNRLQAPAPSPAATTGAIVIPPMPDFSKYGPIEKKPVSSLRKKIAENLTLTWNICPMVTHFDQADITELEAGRKRVTEGLSKDKPKITMTILAMKACVAALKEFPHFNASYDVHTNELIYKKYYHIGIAVDTDRGLLVPVIRDVDKKSIFDLAREVTEVAEKARSGKLSLEDMKGGTFTISNLGGIGGTGFSPIVNYPEVAILGMARSSLQPVVRDGKIDIRLMLPLCLTYDHRVIDGADGARFCAKLVKVMSDPIRLLMES